MYLLLLKVMLITVVKKTSLLMKQEMYVFLTVHVMDVAISTVVMRLITSCTEPGLKSTSLVETTQITKTSITNGLHLSNHGGSMEI